VQRLGPNRRRRANKRDKPRFPVIAVLISDCLKSGFRTELRQNDAISTVDRPWQRSAKGFQPWRQPQNSSLYANPVKSFTSRRIDPPGRTRAAVTKVSARLSSWQYVSKRFPVGIFFTGSQISVSFKITWWWRLGLFNFGDLQKDP